MKKEETIKKKEAIKLINIFSKNKLNLKDFNLFKIICGEIFYVTHQITQIRYIVKKLELEYFFSNDQEEETDLKTFNYIKLEINIHEKSRNHNHIIELIDVLQQEKRKKTEIYLFFVDFGVKLEEVINKILNKELIYKIFLQFTSTIEYLHNLKIDGNQGVIYRNTSLKNIFYDEKSEIIKIMNFEICNYATKNRDTYQCPLEYMFPEIEAKGGYGKEADIWGLGILLYHLLNKRTPFKGDNSEIREAISKLDMTWGLETFDEQHLIISLLKISAKERYSIDKIFDHSLFKNYTNYIQKLRNESIDNSHLIS